MRERVNKWVASTSNVLQVLSDFLKMKNLVKAYKVISGRETSSIFKILSFELSLQICQTLKIAYFTTPSLVQPDHFSQQFPKYTELGVSLGVWPTEPHVSTGS